MKNLLNSTLLLLMLGLAMPVVAQQWTLTRIEADPYSNGWTNAALDERGNRYYALSVTGPFRLGSFSLPGSAGSELDIILFKQRPDGQLAWGKRLGGSRSEQIQSIAVQDGRLYLGGQYSSTDFRFAGNTLFPTQFRAGFLLALDTAGTELWSKTVAVSGGGEQLWVPSLAVGDSGSINLGFNVEAATHQWEGWPQLGHANNGRTDAYVYNYSKSGRPRFYIPYTSTNNAGDWINQIRVDRLGNMFVGGSFGSRDGLGTSTLFFSGTVAVATNGTFGLSDGFVVKYNPQRQVVNAFGVGGTSQDAILDLVPDDSGGVYFSGFFSGTINLGASQLISDPAPGGWSSDDGFIGKADMGLVPIWGVRLGGNGAESPRFLGLTPDGKELIATGTATGPNLVAGTRTFDTPGYFLTGISTAARQISWADLAIGQTNSFMAGNPLILSNCSRMAAMHVVSSSVGFGDDSLTTSVAAAVLTEYAKGGTTLVLQMDTAGRQVCAGSAVEFAVNVTGQGPLTYQWRRNGVPVGSNAATFRLANVTEADSGRYACTVTSPCATATTNALWLRVNPHLVLQAVPQAQVACLGDTVQLSIITQGGRPVRYQWLRGSDPVGQNLPTLTLPGIGTRDTGLYTCRVFGGCDTLTSPPARVSVLDTFATQLVATIVAGQSYPFGPDLLTQPGRYRRTVPAVNGCDSTIYLTLEIITNAEALANGKRFNVFPNPATDVLTIEVPARGTVTLSALAGKTIWHQPCDGQLCLSVASLPRGVYLCRYQGVGSLAVRKVVVE